MITLTRNATSMDAFIEICPFCCARSSTCTHIRSSAWLILHTTSYVCLSVRLYQSGTAHPATFHKQQYTLTTVMMIKSFGTCATSGRR